MTGILAKMNHGMLEREEVLALSLLSAVAGESIFLLGLPGVGKSMVARRLKSAFKGARSFEYLMSRFSTPDEIFGPVSITKLKEEDTYERITAGYLPEADVVFLDELWKAGPAIQNSLLTVLNEKIYLNGNHTMQLPIKGIIAASNELPAQGEGLEALWDRFILRYVVEPIVEQSNFQSLLCPSPQTALIFDSEPFDQQELEQISKEIEAVDVPAPVIEIICNIRQRMYEKMKEQEQEAPGTSMPQDNKQLYYISDRRWKKAVNIMRASACLNGRNEVNYSDLLLLVHMLWNEEGQVQELVEIVCKEVLACLFRGILKQKKSVNRHAVRMSPKPSLYILDGMFYEVLCDGYALKIHIADYETLLESGTVMYASETIDDCLLVRPKGSFTVQVKEEGKIIINNCSYELRTTFDPQITIKQLNSLGTNLEDIFSNLLKSLDSNLFIGKERFMLNLRNTYSYYDAKLNQGR